MIRTAAVSAIADYRERLNVNYAPSIQPSRLKT